MCHAEHALQIASRELREVFGKRAPDFAREKLIHRRDRATRLIQRHTFDAVHRKENRWKTDAFTVGLVDLANKMIERIQVNAPKRHAGRINIQELAPDLLFGRVQTYNDDGMWIHG